MRVKCLVHRKFWIPGVSLFVLMNLKHMHTESCCWRGQMPELSPRAWGVCAWP